MAQSRFQQTAQESSPTTLFRANEIDQKKTDSQPSIAENMAHLMKTNTDKQMQTSQDLERMTGTMIFQQHSSESMPFNVEGQRTSNPMQFAMKDAKKIAEYFEKFQDKLFKIYRRLNIKLESREILREELSASKSVIPGLDAVSGHLNKVMNQVNQAIAAQDQEVAQYKDIISKKLKPQLQRLINENNRMKDQFEEEKIRCEAVEQQELGLRSELAKARGEIRFLRERIVSLQDEVEKNLNESPEIYYNEIKRLKRQL